MMEDNEEWVTNVRFSDVAHFHLDSMVNSQTFRFWGTERPDFVATRPLYSRKCTARWELRNLGPFWFKEDAANTAMINQVMYRSVLTECGASLHRRRLTLKTSWFRQDGDTPHTVIETKNFEIGLFPWNSTDLNPLNFFCGIALKSENMPCCPLYRS